MATSTKKTLGKRKIEIKRIEKKTNLQVTFSKRRGGLFKKAGEIGVLTGSQIALIVQSPSENLFLFGTSDFDSVFRRYDTATGVSEFTQQEYSSSNSSRIEYEELVRQLEAEKKRASELGGTERGWWDKAFEGMDLFEMQEFANALEALGNWALSRADEMHAKLLRKPEDGVSGPLINVESNANLLGCEDSEWLEMEKLLNFDDRGSDIAQLQPSCLDWLQIQECDAMEAALKNVMMPENDLDLESLFN